MSLEPEQAKLLKTALRKRPRPELKRTFAIIRAHEDRTLLNAVAPAAKLAPRRGDPLARELEALLKPVMAPAAEKADMLVEHIAKKHRRKLDFEPKGLADAARRLRAAKLSDNQIRAGAQALIAHLAKLHGRETVV